MAKEIKLSEAFGKVSQRANSSRRKTHREVNLVPDIKDEMIKTLKLRNFIFFLCIVVAIVSISITALAGVIMGGQQIALTSKQNTIDKLSNRLNSYEDLSDYLTIKDQLDSISTLTDNKQVLSRTFNILSALIPTGADTITISELSVDLGENGPLYTFDAQANAGSEPFIDYNVLDSFKKSMEYMHYDYGDYVDKSGNIIPAYCMIETGSDGATFKDPSKGYYAFWTIDAEGCDPAVQQGSSSSETQDDSQNTNSSSSSSSSANSSSSSSSSSSSTSNSSSSYTLEDYEGQKVVRIWRTPQYTEWYKTTPVEGQPYMSLDGTITGVPHFNSKCITYSGDDSQNSSNPKWDDSNNSCQLVPGGIEGIEITDSSNGRDANEQLVLRFSAIISIAPDAYKFSAHHLLALPPSGRHNVTDSYQQVQAMFGQRATDCAEDDSACNSNTNLNEGGN